MRGCRSGVGQVFQPAGAWGFPTPRSDVPPKHPQNLPLRQLCSRSETGDKKVARTGRLENLPHQIKQRRGSHETTPPYQSTGFKDWTLDFRLISSPLAPGLRAAMTGVLPPCRRDLPRRCLDRLLPCMNPGLGCWESLLGDNAALSFCFLPSASSWNSA